MAATGVLNRATAKVLLKATPTTVVAVDIKRSSLGSRGTGCNICSLHAWDLV